MPSTAFTEYKANLKDVHRLVLLHRSLSGTSPGRRGLGHLTRGGIVLLCAAWERYVETVSVEAATFLTRKLPSHASLPAVPRQKVVDYANSGKNAWTAAQLTTSTWTDIYLDALRKRTEALNTPKHENLQPIFEAFLDVPDIATFWPSGKTPIDEFVSLRGEVAHRGAQSTYVHFGQLTKYEQEVTAWVTATDNSLSDHLHTLVTPNLRPWNRT